MSWFRRNEHRHELPTSPLDPPEVVQRKLDRIEAKLRAMGVDVETVQGDLRRHLEEEELRNVMDRAEREERNSGKTP